MNRHLTRASTATTGVVNALAPAKINLTLRVLGRRDDGYHELSSRFATVDVYDRLQFRRREDGEIRLNLLGGGSDVPAGPENLVCRAAAELRKVCGTNYGAEIHLSKRIPSEAGLGGGSSDAATTLLALCRLWTVDVENDVLHDIAAGLGSDLNFFLARTPVADVFGRGEIVHETSSETSRFAVLVKPAFGAKTSEIFREFGIAPPLGNGVARYPKFVQMVRSQEAAGFLANDLFTAAITCVPGFGPWLERLIAVTGRGDWRLSGSGTAVFLPVASPRVGRRIVSTIRSHCGLGPDDRMPFVGTVRIGVRGAIW